MKKLFIANWKMNLGFRQSVALAQKYKLLADKKFKLAIAPGFPMLKAIKQLGFDVAAQNCSAWASGAHTGEVSCDLLKELGCRYVIIGHSERRIELGESNELINKKMAQAVLSKLTPVLCFGEKKNQLKNREKVIVEQIKTALNLVKPTKLILAYEPVWAIGSGYNCSADEVNRVYQFVRDLIVNLSGQTFFDKNVDFLYGGSVDSKNIKAYANQKFLAGLLVGKSSLNIKETVKMANWL
ncbi:MAG: triose-phosphate isomerase [Patescibacteria group bacterium]